MNAQELANKVCADWFVNGTAMHDDTKVTVRDVELKLASFKQVSRALGLECPFSWDDALDAAEIIAANINSSIDAANNYDLG